MSDGSLMRMEEFEEAEENELLGGEEGEEHDDVDVGDDVDETAEDLMTDMKLEDEIDEVRAVEPDFNWTYHIEIYPWSADDMTDNFVRLIKLAQFSQIFMRKKGISKEVNDSEKIDDRLPSRQRKGCLHFYTDTYQNAKNIMRCSTWKTMTAKELTFEITKRGPDLGHIETAYLELDTFSASKSRFRDKAKGEFKDRSAKVSNLPGTISREFLDVVFSRAYAVISGTTVKEYLKEREGNLQQKLLDIKGFDGSLNFDCLGRGSCRSFVLAHKNVLINGKMISIEPNDKETMVVPPSTHDIVCSIKKKVEKDFSPSSTQPLRGRGGQGRGTQVPLRGGGGSFSSANGRGFVKDTGMIAARGRGLGRGFMPPQRPVSAPFIRAGPGMPVPMTGRQKMNEKMRRNHFGMGVGASGGSSGLLATPSGLMGARGPVMGSVGVSFKHEIASLQNQLERSTQALEAKIAILQQTTQGGTFYDGDITGFDDGSWDDGDFDYNDGYGNEDFVLGEGGYGTQEMQTFHTFEAPVRPRRAIPGSQIVAQQSLGPVSAPQVRQHLPRGPASQGMRRAETRGGPRGRGLGRGTLPTYW